MRISKETLPHGSGLCGSVRGCGCRRLESRRSTGGGKHHSTRNGKRRYTGLLFEAGLHGCGLGFVAGFGQEGKHVALIGFYAGLVEGVDAEDVTRDAAGFLEEVDQFAQVKLGERGDGDEDVGHSAVDVGDAGAEFGHLVHFVDMLACEIVETIEVGCVGGDDFLFLGLGH